MGNSEAISFDELVVYRQQLQDFCSRHYNSVNAFQSGNSFKLNLTEGRLGQALRHLSSSATCIESLLECPEGAGHKEEAEKLANQFARLSMSSADDDWKSDGSAHIYCRCRTLPLVVRYLPKYDRTIERHLKCILRQLKMDHSRFAIGEAPMGSQVKESWYPPNAFHTCWTFQLLETIEERFPAAFTNMCNRFRETRFDIERIRQEMLLWAKHVAGRQIALHASNSSTLDSDQLAWSLAILLRFDQDFQADLAQQDFIRHGLQCLFEEQTSTGIWRTGAPLFHYRTSGNAHCYVFETISVLLRSVLTKRKEGVFLRQTLRPFASQLIKLWLYAKSTEIHPPEYTKAAVWSSGHRVNRKEPESWATASVYCFAQCLRRLVGIWTREEASEQLRVSAARQPAVDPERTLSERGDTWPTDGETTASQLMTLFVNPCRYFGAGNRLEPDSQPIHNEQARAAILFGPPGTSKTTLARCVADAIAWDYVELHASSFVADGLPNVQRTANAIFERLLQLDRAVILFDEIDELVRAREMEPDAFGRFLTTSMLPKLAELWRLRKVIYFVATNHIAFFDPAVTRSQRFDALIHVSPPSLCKKLNQLKEILTGRYRRVRIHGLECDEVESALQTAAERANSSTPKGEAGQISHQALPTGCVLAKFLLMRWDQLQELASIIARCRPAQKSITIGRRILELSLLKLSDQSLQKRQPFVDFLDARKYEQHDFSKMRIWRIRGRITNGNRGKCKVTTDPDGNSAFWFVPKAPVGGLSELPSDYVVVSPGVVEYRKHRQ